MAAIGHPSDALAARQSALDFLDTGWTRYADKIEDDLYGFAPIKVADPAGAMRRFKVAASVALEHGPTYWWSPDMSSALDVLHRSVPDAPLARDLVVAPSGFFYYAEPIPLGMSDRGIVATAWITTAEDGGDTRFGWGIDYESTGVCVIHFCSPNSKQVVPVTLSPWSYGNTMQTHVEQIDVMGGHGTEEAIKQGEYSGLDLLRLFTAAHLFLKQKVAGQRREAPAWREMDRSLKQRNRPRDLDIQVVYLREREPAGVASDGVRRTVEWSCRWWVGLSTAGFWRNQPTKDGPRRILISPYVKGPSDKPLNRTKTVFAVTR